MPITQAWGMTETSPIASVAHVKSTLRGGTDEELANRRATVGLPVPGVEVRVVEPGTTNELPWDGESSGRAAVPGPVDRGVVLQRRPRAASRSPRTGWLKTGDVATIDGEGYIRLVDRTKDLIKSGGEWISSVELENELMAHPDVAEAAVVGVTSTKWGERPLACVVMKPGATLDKAALLDFLEPRVAKWWLPDEVVEIEEVPKTSVGKFSKKTLRDRFADTVVP